MSSNCFGTNQNNPHSIAPFYCSRSAICGRKVGLNICSSFVFLNFLFEDQFEGGRLARSNVGTWERLNVETFERANVGTFERWAAEPWSVHGGEPPFVGGNKPVRVTRLVKSCASGANHTSFPPERATPNLAKFLAFLLGRGWKNGRLECEIVGVRGRLNPSLPSGQAVGTWKRLNVRPMRCAECIVVILPSLAIMIWLP